MVMVVCVTSRVCREIGLRARGRRRTRPKYLRLVWVCGARSRWSVVALLLVGVAVGMVLAQARPAESDVPGAGSVDVGFAQDMQVHLSQAVKVAQERSTDPAVHP
jgi:hypothetical protein